MNGEPPTIEGLESNLALSNLVSEILNGQLSNALQQQFNRQMAIPTWAISAADTCRYWTRAKINLMTVPGIVVSIHSMYGGARSHSISHSLTCLSCNTETPYLALRIASFFSGTVLVYSMEYM